MSDAQKITIETATPVAFNKPSYGFGFSGISGLVPANTGTKWFTRMMLVEAIGSAGDRA